MRCGEGSILFLELAEQPRVLDGDHGLVGESFQQRDLLLGVWALLVAVDSDYTDGPAFTKQWRSELRPLADRLKRRARLRKVSLHGRRHVWHMNALAFEERASRYRPQRQAWARQPGGVHPRDCPNRYAKSGDRTKVLAERL